MVMMMMMMMTGTGTHGMKRRAVPLPLVPSVKIGVSHLIDKASIIEIVLTADRLLCTHKLCQ